MSKHIAIGFMAIGLSVAAGVALAVADSSSNTDKEEPAGRNVSIASPAESGQMELPEAAKELAVADEPVSAPVSAAPVGMPKRVGECARTTIKEIATRLEDTPGSGSFIELANGVYGVSYDQVPEVDQSRVGDEVSTCLIEIPEDCPPGDDRGRVYETVNLRTGWKWSLPDSEHMCGGA